MANLNALVKTPRIIAGLDPGLSSGGLVIFQREPEKILETFSFSEKRGEIKKIKDNLDMQWGDKEFTVAIIRANNWLSKLNTKIEELPYEIDVWAIESFVDQRSRAREEKQLLLKNRWMTPLVMGMVSEKLEEKGFSIENNNIFYQNAGIVIRQMHEEIARLKNRKTKTNMIVDNDITVTNDHLRKAFAHALALHLRLPKL